MAKLYMVKDDFRSEPMTGILVTDENKELQTSEK